MSSKFTVSVRTTDGREVVIDSSGAQTQKQQTVAPAPAPVKNSPSESEGEGPLDAHWIARREELARLTPSAQQSAISGGTSDVLPAERARASFDTETMVTVLDGGKKNTVKRRWIAESHANFKDKTVTSEKYDMERGGEKGQVATLLKNFTRIHAPHFERGYVPRASEYSMMQAMSLMNGYPGYGLFLSTLNGQASDEQKGWWFWRAFSLSITGAYAQTELGHGSNVRGLQTIAEYDKETEEFVLNTPTLQSIKFWPSSLVCSTHCVLYAQLIMDGKEMGVHVFFLQLRDENLLPLPGIEIGDVGTKVGDNAVDVGYMKLTNVRIPRRHMMEKRQYITKEGRYVKRTKKGGGDDEKMHYLTMVGARVQLAEGSSASLAKAAVIAIRYSCVRKQGFKDTSSNTSFRAEENAIFDYKMHQYRLFKQLAWAFSIRFATNWIQERLAIIIENPEDVGKDLPEIHASSAGLKGLCCDKAAVGIEDCRKCCGGHGYLLSSGIAPLEADFKWRSTAEGDTVVMLLQTARYLMKCFAAVRKGDISALSGLTECLAPLSSRDFDLQSIRPRLATRTSDWMDLSYLVEVFAFRTIANVRTAGDALQARLEAGEAFDDAWQALSLQMVRTGESHVVYFMLDKFAKTTEDTEDHACRAVMARLCALFALSEFLDGPMWGGLFSVSETALAQAAASELCSALRPDAIALTDSWDFPDRVLNTVLGMHDGNIYEAIYKASVLSPLNRQIVPRFLQAIKPQLDAEFLALRNGLCEDALLDEEDNEVEDNVASTTTRSRL